jgi:hypothetical protein
VPELHGRSAGPLDCTELGQQQHLKNRLSDSPVLSLKYKRPLPEQSNKIISKQKELIM